MAVALLFGPVAGASVVSLEQDGSNVVATGSGTLNTTALSGGYETLGTAALISPQAADLLVGGYAMDEYNSIAGPTSFGSSSSLAVASSVTGDRFGVEAGEALFVPDGYVSGADLSGTATWDDATLASLGVTPVSTRGPGDQAQQPIPSH